MARPNFSEDTRHEVVERAGWKCECGTIECLREDEELIRKMFKEAIVYDFHHRHPNTKAHQKLYGAWLQSAENCKLVKRKCHENGEILNSFKFSREFLAERRKANGQNSN